jgi:hypothetical protein
MIKGKICALSLYLQSLFIPLQQESFIGDMNVFPSYYGRGKYEPIVRGPIKQVYLAHEAGINASRTIGSFLMAVVVINDRP